MKMNARKTSLRILIVLGMSVTACSHNQATRHPSAADWEKIDEATIQEALNFELIPGEAWGVERPKDKKAPPIQGTRATEAKVFLSHVNEVMAARNELVKINGTENTRVFHQKQHGCLVGELQIMPANPSIPHKSYRGGMFKEPRTYPALIRFSNGVGIDADDNAPDVRGIGVKVFDVMDDSTKELKTVDINFTNSPIPFGRDQEQFIQFMKANLRGNFDLAKGIPAFAWNNPTVAGAIGNNTLRLVYSLLSETYWSGHPYRMESAQGVGAVKFSLKPIHEGGWRWNHRGDIGEILKAKLAKYNREHKIKKKDATETAPAGLFDGIDTPKLPPGIGWVNTHRNILKENLRENVSTKKIGFALSIIEPWTKEKSPIEDNLVAWEDQIHSEVVGRLVFDKQVETKELEALCDSAVFTPGHFVTQHRPVSNLGRGRIFSYRLSAMSRHASTQEVTLKQFNELRQAAQVPSDN